MLDLFSRVYHKSDTTHARPGTIVEQLSTPGVPVGYCVEFESDQNDSFQTTVEVLSESEIISAERS